MGLEPVRLNGSLRAREARVAVVDVDVVHMQRRVPNR